MIYGVFVYDSNGDIAASLWDAGSPRYSRSKNAADQISIVIPRNSSNVSEIKTGRRFEIVRSWDDQIFVEASGFISNHGYSGDEYEIEGFTEEILLSQYLTPNQYGYPLYSENATLEDLANELSSTYKIVRVKENWSDYEIANTNIDYTSNPVFLILDTITGQDENLDGQDDYYPTGSITFRFQKQSDETWERIRWVSDYYATEDGEEKVTTKVSYRVGSTTGSMGNFTTPDGGSLTDIVGLVVASQQTDNFLDVKIDFATDSVASSPVFFSLEIIKRTPSQITNVVVASGADQIVTPNLAADNETFFKVLTDACAPSGWEFRIEDYTLYVAETFGSDKSNDFAVVAS